MVKHQVRILVRDDNAVAWSALEARKLAKTIGYDEHIGQMIATAVSELAYNIVKYAGRGEILMGQITAGSRVGLEVVARDKGPGIEDTQQAMADRFSSGGTLGLGLPGVKRLMDEFSLDSAPGEGTRVIARTWI